MAAGFLDRVTPIVLTYNEAPNIARVLDTLSWAGEVVVVDSGSDDGTLDLLRGYGNVRCLHRPFDTHADQWNFALHETGIGTEWVLALDADYVATDALVSELAALAPETGVGGYRARFRYCVAGIPLRGSVYPPVTVLYRREAARYVQDGHTQRVQVAGAVHSLRHPMLHDDRKPLSRWLWAQDRYASLEAAVLLATPWRALRTQDRLRRLLVITPWLVPLYCLTVGRGALDGWPGLHYALQRGVAEAVLALKLIETRIARGKS